MSAETQEIPCKMPRLSDDDLKQTTIPTTCAYWVQKKKRFCKMTAAKGRKYCCEHEPVNETQDASNSDRIPCPLDSKHSVYKKHLEKHLKICNARPMENLPPYIRKGINLGQPVIEDQSNIRLADLDDEEFFGVIKKVNDFYAEHVEGKIATIDFQHKILSDEVSNDEYGKDTKKHLIQAAALLGILEDAGQLQDATSFVEYGAGKGQLAYYLAQLLQGKQHSQVVLLDRMSLRHKRDNKIEDRSLVQRIRVDIADFCLEEYEPGEKKQRYVAVSKHLCGGATDLALRCIANSIENSNSTEINRKPITEFIMIALCCHHRCDWRTFVGKEFLRKHNVTQREFVILTKMASWFVSGTGMSREKRRELEEQQKISPSTEDDSKKQQRLSLHERESVGFKCKRFLDFARLDFLKQHGYEGELKYYVKQDVTLENICLLATKIPNKLSS